MNRAYRLLLTGLCMLGAAWPMASQAEEQTNICGPIYNTGHYGPYDYRTDKDKLHVVELYHFAPQVELLVRGQSGELGGDLSYVLKAFPNHHRALVSIVRLGERTKSLQPPFLTYSIECFLERAVRFRPDDTVARSLYAQYLGKLGRADDGAAQLDVALRVAGENPLTQYNIGLVFFELGKYDRALQQAHKARQMGVERKDLEEMLRRANHWQDPPP